MREPSKGSVVLAYGVEGTAYQRFFSTDMWHGTNGAILYWEELSVMGDIIVIHEVKA